MTMITPSYLGETIEYSSLHACRSTLEDPTNSAVETITVYLVRSGGGPGPTNIKIPSQQLAVGQTYVSPELAGAVLNVGDALYGFSTDGDVVTYTINGAVFS